MKILANANAKKVFMMMEKYNYAFFVILLGFICIINKIINIAKHAFNKQIKIALLVMQQL